MPIRSTAHFYLQINIYHIAFGLAAQMLKKEFKNFLIQFSFKIQTVNKRTSLQRYFNCYPCENM